MPLIVTATFSTQFNYANLHQFVFLLGSQGDTAWGVENGNKIAKYQLSGAKTNNRVSIPPASPFTNVPMIAPTKPAIGRRASDILSMNLPNLDVG